MTDSDATPLRVLFIAPEMVPLSKSGQVADVIGALPRSLAELGHDVRVAVPRYHHSDTKQLATELLIDALPVPVDGHHDMAAVFRTMLEPTVTVYMIDNPRHFVPGVTSAYADDVAPFVFHSRAALEMLSRPEIDWQPDVIHCHDWQTALVPNWLATLYKNDPFFAHTASVFTIHRLSHHGIYGYRALEVAGIKEYGFIYYAGLSAYDELVHLVGRGVYYADVVTTVSERYAREIQTPEFGEGLDPLLRDRSDVLFGIRNGIDAETFDPAHDGCLAAPFDATFLDQRVANKTALQRSFDLELDPDAPLVGMVSRLNDNKGFDLLSSTWDTLMAHTDVQVAILGLGDSKYHEQLSQRVRAHSGRIGLRLSFDEAHERLLYGGSDMFLMPSRVEPCGLGQMLAMRYGSVPVVRTTGGLADCVEDYDPRTRSGNGFVFEAYDSIALFATLVRAIETHKHREAWRALQQRCMDADFGWTSSAQHYVEAYRLARILRQRGRRSGDDRAYQGVRAIVL